MKKSKCFLKFENSREISKWQIDPNYVLLWKPQIKHRFPRISKFENRVWMTYFPPVNSWIMKHVLQGGIHFLRRMMLQSRYQHDTCHYLRKWVNYRTLQALLQILKCMHICLQMSPQYCEVQCGTHVPLLSLPSRSEGSLPFLENWFQPRMVLFWGKTKLENHTRIIPFPRVVNAGCRAG